MPTLTVQSSGVNDTFLDYGAPTSNNGSAEQGIAGCMFGSPNHYRLLLKFDISSIPAGAVITSATLSLWYGTLFGSNATGTIEVYRVKRAWVENQATWNIWSTGNNWSTAGCDDTTNDREASNIGTASTPASPTAGTQQDITLDNAKIQEMISGGSFTNNGFMLKQQSESTWENGHEHYLTDYAADSTKRPKLVIVYNETQNRTVLGKARIQKAVTQTIQGISRVQKVVSQTILGKATIESGIKNQHILGKSRIQKVVNQVLLGKARIEATVLRTILGKARLQKAVTQTIQGISRIQKVVNQTLLGRARIHHTVDQNILGKANLVYVTIQTILGKSRIQAVVSRTITGKARISKSIMKQTSLPFDKSIGYAAKYSSRGNTFDPAPVAGNIFEPKYPPQSFEP